MIFNWSRINYSTSLKTKLINPFQTGTCLLWKPGSLFFPNGYIVQTEIDFILKLKKNRMWCTMRVKQSGDEVTSCLLSNGKGAKLSVVNIV